MTKVPQAGEVKTRLQPFLTPEQCCELSARFLQDTENKAKILTDDLIIAFSPKEKKEILLNILQYPQILIEQTGENLGEKMFHAFEFAFARGSDAVVMIGTDSPNFPAGFLEQAFVFLQSEADAVLGKTADGGFYLIGLRRLDKQIFENVEWSSPKTFEQTKRNIKNLNFNLKEIPHWFDVDVPVDLRKLTIELSENSLFAPKTFKFLTDLDLHKDL